MEVKAIGHGGQNTINSDINYDITVQVNKTKSLEKIQSDDDKNTYNSEISEKKLEHAVNKLNKVLEDSHTHAEYEFHDKLKNDLMIKIVNTDSGEVIREVPPKKILDMVAKMMELVGILIDKKA